MIMENFYTKSEIARMIINQYPLTEKENNNLIDTLVKDIVSYDETSFKDEIVKAGINCENFGYNRYFIKL